MIYDQKQFRQNLVLTALILGVVVVAMLAPNLSDQVRTAVAVGAIGVVAALFRRSGRGSGPPDDDDDPPGVPVAGGSGPALPVLCLAVLAFAACRDVGQLDYCAGVHLRSPDRHEAQTSYGLNGDYVRMAEQSAVPTQCSGFGCIYTRSSDHLIRLVDTSGNERIMGEASRLRSNAGTPGDVAESWIWYDSSTGLVMFRDSSAAVALAKAGSTGYAAIVPVTGGGTGALGAATKYLVAPGAAATSTEYQLALFGRAGTARNLYCKLGTAPGGSDTVTVTVRKNGSDQAVTCVISAAATTCNDTSHTFGVVAADRMSIKAVSTATTAADLTCGIEVLP